MNSSLVPAAAWSEEAVALAALAVQVELREVDSAAVMAAARRCRVEVPVTKGLRIPKKYLPARPR